eukprot:GHRR01012108.1.p2 GENE.GHRR01012108.1~~GHRR01012108.1.p2  ORF type:complete len:129 (-),score=45.63 GHRR01012108.1:1391-1777(-)
MATMAAEYGPAPGGTLFLLDTFAFTMLQAAEAAAPPAAAAAALVSLHAGGADSLGSAAALRFFLNAKLAAGLLRLRHSLSRASSGSQLSDCLLAQARYCFNLASLTDFASLQPLQNILQLSDTNLPHP